MFGILSEIFRFDNFVDLPEKKWNPAAIKSFSRIKSALCPDGSLSFLEIARYSVGQNNTSKLLLREYFVF